MTLRVGIVENHQTRSAKKKFHTGYNYTTTLPLHFYDSHLGFSFSKYDKAHLNNNKSLPISQHECQTLKYSVNKHQTPEKKER